MLYTLTAMDTAVGPIILGPLQVLCLPSIIGCDAIASHPFCKLVASPVLPFILPSFPFLETALSYTLSHAPLVPIYLIHFVYSTIYFKTENRPTLTVICRFCPEA